MIVSVTTTSGELVPTRGSASRPSPASATTTMSGCESSKARTPWRSMAWSSTSNTRMTAAEPLNAASSEAGDERRRGVATTLPQPPNSKGKAPYAAMQYDRLRARPTRAGRRRRGSGSYEAAPSRRRPQSATLNGPAWRARPVHTLCAHALCALEFQGFTEPT